MSKTTTEMISEAAVDEPCPLCHPGGNIPNAETAEALRQSESGEGITKFDSLEDLIEWYESEICS